MESLQIANAIFTKTTPKKTFTSKAEKFNSYIDKLTSVDQVNNWVSKKTNKKITNIINSISNIEFLIVNAVYFKNQWSHPFTKSSTKKDYFHINSSKNVSVTLRLNFCSVSSQMHGITQPGLFPRPAIQRTGRRDSSRRPRPAGCPVYRLIFMYPQVNGKKSNFSEPVWTAPCCSYHLRRTVFSSTMLSFITLQPCARAVSIE